MSFSQKIDLSRHDFTENPIIELKSTWERKWGLIEPKKWHESTATSQVVTVPDLWIKSPGGEHEGSATYHIKLVLPDTKEVQLGLFFMHLRSAARIYINGEPIDSLGIVGDQDQFKSGQGSLLISLPDASEISLVIQISNQGFNFGGLAKPVQLGKISALGKSLVSNTGLDTLFSGIILALSLYLFAMFFLHRQGYAYLFLALICLSVAIRSMTIENASMLLPTLFPNLGWEFWKKLEYLSVYSIVAWFPLYVGNIFPSESNRKILAGFTVLSVLLCLLVVVTPHNIYSLVLDITHAGLLGGFVFSAFVSAKALRSKHPEAKTLVTGILIAMPFIVLEILRNSSLNLPIPFTRLVETGVLTFLLFQGYILAERHSFTFMELEFLVEVKTRELMESNKSKDEANRVLEATLQKLKSTQTQLIQSEKMSSLGELTAGIAHEIQNPLNFVNNFSEVNSELISEMKEALAKGNVDEARHLATALEENESKIVSHGKRADAIVKGMLQHSRKSSGQKEPTDINALCDEYLRLAYHGLRAKDKSFNAKFETQLDPSLPRTKVVPQEIGRVVLNLINNAFYACSERSRSVVNEQRATNNEAYEPTVTVSTKRSDNNILISVKDNGNGIPANIKEKIFQPFFTTKPTGQGTGLGLSLSYDIITKGHGGELKVMTKEGQGSEFIIQLPSS